MKKKQNIIALALLPITLCFQLNAQVTTNRPQQDTKYNSRISESRNTIAYTKLNEPVAIEKHAVGKWLLSNVLKTESDYSFQFQKENTDRLGFTHLCFQEMYNGIPVEYGVYKAHLKNGMLQTANGEFYDNIKINTTPTVSKKDAFQNALKNSGAERYVNDSTYNFVSAEQNGTLAIIKVENDFHLVYKFDIFSEQPLRRDYVFVDAHSGKIISEENRICHFNSTGTAVTGYYGTQNIITDSVSPTVFHLRDSTRGKGVVTLNKHHDNYNYSLGYDFTNSSNYWNSPTSDRYAYDAHYGAEMSYDFFYNRFGRNSFDDAGTIIYGNLYWSNNYIGSFFSGYSIFYGEGDLLNYYPYTSLEIVGHEITHGMIAYSTKLAATGEPGALNESFCDMFGNTIRFTYQPAKATWLCGDEVVVPTGTGAPARNMSNPKQFLHPDTYLGQYWNTTATAVGATVNSGVANYWYYLLSSGGSGVNDLGNAYTVSGIGLDNAIAIAYRTLDSYLTPNSDFADARFYSLMAATDLFGSCSNEVYQVAKAWYAVGVGDSLVDPARASFYCDSFFCAVPVAVSFINSSENASTYYWDFGDGNFSTDTSPVHTYLNTGNYTVKLVANGSVFCVGTDSVIKTNCISVNNIQVPQSASCTPTTLNPNANYGIFNVDFATIHNSSQGALGYEDFSCAPVTTVIAGDPFPITVTTSSITNYYENVKAFLDYDNSGTFDSVAEMIFKSDYVFKNHTGIVYTSPAATLNTPVRLRIIDANTNYIISNACTDIPYGQAEDYSVTFVSSTQKPVADFTSNVDSVSPVDSIHFFDLSINGVTSWYWEFEGGFPSFSAQRNPTIIYTTPGTYKVKLIAANSFGTDSIIKTAFIRVLNSYRMCKGPSETKLTSGTLYDSGGPSGSYQPQEYCSFLIAPECASNISLNVSYFNAYYDVDFRVYDGSTTSAQLIMALDENSQPPAYTTAYSGAMLITWQNTGIYSDPGFIANWTSLINMPVSPVAAFSVSDANPPLNTPVQFTNLTTPSPVEWKWDFGDGNFSLLQNPAHSFSTPGLHTVTLVVRNCNSSDTISQTINVQQAAVYSIVPLSLQATLGCNDSTIVQFKIKNTGNGSLYFYSDTSIVNKPKKVLINYSYPSQFKSNLDSITQFYSNFTYDTIKNLNDVALFQTRLEDKDVLLLNVASVSQLLQPIILNFINNGGTVIIRGIYYFPSNFFTGTYIGEAVGVPLFIADSANVLVDSVAQNFISPDGTHLQNFTDNDKVQVVSYYGYDVVTYKRIGRGEVIYVGFETGYFSSYHEVNRILSNTIKYADIYPLAPYASVSPHSGLVLPGDSIIINVAFNSTGYNSGTYNSYILLNTSDAMHPVDSVPVSMIVNGNATINLSDTCLQFGNVYQNATPQKKLTVENTSCDSLRITSTNITNASFTISPGSMVIAPHSSGNFVVSFNSPSLNSYSAALTLFNNAKDTTICLSAQTYPAPQIAVSNNSIHVNLSCSDSTVIPFYIKNTGSDTLQYQVDGCGSNVPIKVLALLYGMDTVKQYPNLFNGINQYFTDYVLDITYTRSSSQIDNLLATHDVLLIPDQGTGTNPTDTQFTQPFKKFMDNGGTIIIAGGNYYVNNWLFKYGLFTGSYIYSNDYGVVERIDSTDILVDSIPRLINFTYYIDPQNITNADKKELLTFYGDDIFTYRNISKGRAYYAGYNYAYTGNPYISRMIAGAIRYANSEMPSWISANPTSGNVASGDSVLVNLTFSAGTLATGNYAGYIVIHSNDPLNPVDSIPVSITVSGQPEIVLSDSCIDFGTIIQYKSHTDSIIISNAGCDSLVITNASINNSAFTLLAHDSVIGPYSWAKFKIVFNPQTAGNISGLLTLTSNAPDTAICLTGISTLAPQINISPDTLHASLSCNQPGVFPFYVINTGGDSLSFSAFNNQPVKILAWLNNYNNYGNLTYYGIQSYFTNYTIDTLRSASSTELQNRLKGKDVLLIINQFANDSVSKTLLANVVQNFVAQGGTVVVIGSNFPGTNDIIYDYNLFTGPYLGSLNSSGQVILHNTSDSLMQGVTSYTGGGNIFPKNISGFDKVQLIGSQVFDVATYRNIGAGKAVYLGYDFTTSSYTFNRILSNCVRFSRKTVLPAWLSINPTGNLLTAGDSLLINANINPAGYPGGDYYTYINFNTNDPLRSVDSVCIHLNISGSAALSLSDSCLDFQSVIQHHTVYDSIIISNTGCETLIIDSIVSSNSAFNYTINTPIIPPYGKALAVVAFHPVTTGNISGSLIVYNNVHDTILCLNGISTPAPVINVNPDSVAVTLSCHDSINIPIHVSNTGGGKLHYNITASGDNDSVNVLVMMTNVNYYNKAYNYLVDSVPAYFPKFRLDTTKTINPAYLKSKLRNKDVVIFPPTSNGILWSQPIDSVINDFVLKGGTVIALGHTYSGSSTSIYSYGLFTGDKVGSMQSPAPLNIDTSNNLMENIPLTFTSPPYTSLQKIINHDKITVASYHSYDAITYRQVGLGKVIYLGFTYDTDNMYSFQIMGNAFKYTNLIAFPSWFNVSSLSDSVDAADSSTVIIEINSSGYAPGYYSGYLVFQSDDPLHVTDSVFITMNVTGNLSMNINKTCFDFDSIQQYATEYDTLKIYNSSCDTLRIDSINFTDNAYHLSPVALNIAPGGKGTFIISLNPQTLGSHSAWLNVYTNIIDTAICVDGNSITSPLMSFNPDSIYADLTCFDSLTIPVYIHNTNNGVLNFNFNLPGNFTTKKVLIWPVGNVGSANYINMINGINQHFTNYSIDTSSTHSDTVLQNKLHDKNILLVPPLTDNDTVNSQSFASAIQNFITYGGTVIVCGSDLYGTGNRIYDFGLFTGSYYGYDYSTISVMDATDALMDSVPLSFNSSGNTYSQIITDADKKLLAQTFGRDIVTSKNIGLGKAIYAGFVFANSNNSVQSSQILSNAIEFAHPHNPVQFVTVSADSGSVNPGDSMLVYVTVYSNNFSPGLHYDSIQIVSNDPLTPVYYLPVTLNVNMSKKISLSDTCLNFNATSLSKTNCKAITITNNSCDSVFANSIFSSDSNFQVLTPQLALAPGESSEVVIGFHPDTIGSFSGIITILNDVNDTSFCLSGTSIAPSQIVISTDSLVVNLSACGDSITVPLYVFNAGVDTLQFHINLKNDTVKVLVMLYGVDTVNEYANMISGINQYFTNYKIYKTYTTSPVELQYLLNDKDVLLIPKQDFGNALNNYSFGPLLQSFISYGGEVVVCGSDYANSENRIYDYGFFNGNFVNKLSSGTLGLMNFADPFLTSVGSVYPYSYTYYHHLNDTDKTRLVTYGIDDVVSYRKIGMGKSVFLGYDYFENYNTGANRILSNTIKYSVKRTNASWLKIDPDSGNVAGGDSTLLNISFNSKTYVSGTYRDTIWFYSNDPLNPVYAYPVVMKVVPCAAFSYSQNGCSGYVSFVSSTGGATSWQWDFGDGSVAAIQSPTHLYADSGSYIVRLIACNTNGCDTITDFMYLADVSGPKNAGCQPVPTSTCCGIGIWNVSVNTINNSSSDATEGYMDFSCDISTSLVAGNTYTVTVTTSTSFPENVKVWIDYNNNATFDVATETILTSNSILTNHTGTFVVPSSAIMNIPLRMRVKDENTSFAVLPCNNPDDGQAEDYAVLILPNTSPPVANYWFNIINNCTGNYQFTNLSQNAPTWFKWYFGDGDSSSLQNPVHQYDSSGIYNVWLIAGNAFGSDTLGLLIGVHALNPDFNVTGILETGQSLQFIPVASNASTYFWDFGDGNTSTLQSPAHVYNTSGIYPVSLVVTDSVCGVVSYETLNVITVGINENADLQSVTVSPNPFIDEVNIKYHLINSTKVTIEIENAEGQIISLITSNEKQKGGNHSYSFKPIAKGFYILKVTMNGTSRSFRLIKM
ncbi:MAG: PKD domain-containing protein [Bacteroidia bacterium]